jgi:hypothetical protein
MFSFNLEQQIDVDKSSKASFFSYSHFQPLNFCQSELRFTEHYSPEKMTAKFRACVLCRTASTFSSLNIRNMATWPFVGAEVKLSFARRFHYDQ